MINLINRTLQKVTGKREKIDPEDIGFAICVRVNKIVNNYYKERDFNFAIWDDKYIEKRLKMYFDENSLNRFIRNLSFQVDEENETITAIIDFVYGTFEHEYKINFEVDAIRSLFKDLDIVTFEKSGAIRYAGELLCFIRRGNSGDFDSFELYSNKDGNNKAEAKVYYAGNMENKLPHGKGTLYWKNGKLLYEGEFKEGKVTGYGVSYFVSGGISEVGYRIDGVLNGEVTTYYENGQIEYKGNYKDNIPHGYGTAYYSDSRLEYDGEWDEGYAIDGRIMRSPNGINFRYTKNGILIVDNNGEKIKSISQEELNELIS